MHFDVVSAKRMTIPFMLLCMTVMIPNITLYAQQSLQPGDKWICEIDAYTGDTSTTQPKEDANDGRNGDNPYYRRHNVARAHGFYWYTSKNHTPGEPYPWNEQWVDYKPPLGILGKGRYRIIMQYREGRNRAGYPAQYFVYHKHDTTRIDRIQATPDVGGVVWFELGEFDLGKDGFVRVYDKGTGSISFGAMELKYRGPSWNRPITVPGDANTIQEAIDMTANGDTVLVAPGRYQENINFLGRSICVISHFAITGDSSYIENTILDGNFQGSVVTWDEDENENTLLQGFTIVNGMNQHGGGLHIANSSEPVIRDCVIKNNVSHIAQIDDGGGGIHITGESSPVFIGCTISHNFAKSPGGGVFITGNSDVVFERCRIFNNVTSDNIFYRGAGLFCKDAAVDLYHTLVYGNAASGEESALTFAGTADAEMINCTVAMHEKKAIEALGASSLTIRNSILYNAPAEITGNITIEYSNVRGGHEGQGNIDEDPLFADPHNGDFTLSPDSPCIDAGNPSPEYNDTEDPDRPGSPLNPARGGLENDMGAFGGNMKSSVYPQHIPAVPLRDGSAGISYSDSLDAFAHGTPPFVWNIVRGELPDSLVLENQTGLVSGIAKESGESTFLVLAADEQSSAERVREYSLSILNKQIVIITDTLKTGTLDLPYSETIKAQGGEPPYTWSVQSGSLPPGLELNSQNGVISGTPSHADVFDVVMRVQDNSETPLDTTKAFSLSIVPQELIIVTPELDSGKVNAVFNDTLQAEGGIEPYTWSVESGTLPGGLILDNGSGIISGIPVEYGEFAFTLQVTDDWNEASVKSKTYNLKISPADLEIITETLAAGQLFVDYKDTVTISGGTDSLLFTLTAGRLPDSLEINATSGVISGKPAEYGQFPLTVQVADQKEPAFVQSKSYVLLIDSLDLQILTTRLDSGKQYQDYEDSLKADKGLSPYKWSLIQGTLPQGIEFDSSNAVLHGEPVEFGSYELVFRVEDSQPPPVVKEITLLLYIEPSLLRITTEDIKDGSFDDFYSDTLKADGGMPPYTWSFASDIFPPGLSLADSSGVLSGQPQAMGVFEFVAQVTDAQTVPMVDTRTYRITIAPPALTLTTTVLDTGKVDQSYSDNLTATGGYSPYQWGLVSGQLPIGVELDTTSGELRGTPTRFGNYNFVVRVMDSNVPALVDTQKVTLTILPRDLSIIDQDVDSAIVNTDYADTLSAVGGIPSYTWMLAAPVAGFQLDPETGILSGVPQQVGTYILTVYVEDSQEPAARDTMVINLYVKEQSTSAVTGLQNDIPLNYRLGQNYPNPFNPTTTITYDLPKAGWITVSIYDRLGREIRIIREYKKPGTHTYIFKALDLPSGIYFYTLRCQDFIDRKKMILVK
ncbi:T9SS type A sorting domain-containing protein [candidate division KSB1 bacterium]|nr:T9SS type A sorting domain-containing protein [candidate division KSB1 bacterium]